MYLALRELRHYPVRSLLLGAVVTLIAFMVFMLTGLTRGLAHDNAALLLGTPARHFVTTHDAEGVFTRSFLTPADVDAVRQAAGPTSATPVAQTFVSFSRGDRQLSGVLLGVDPGRFMAPAATQGRALIAATPDAVAQRRRHGSLLPVERVDQRRGLAPGRPGAAHIRGQAER